MPKKSIKLWELSNDRGVGEIELPETSSLDTITRKLPQGFYTTFRTYDRGKRVLGLRAHLQRLYQPAAAQGITPSVSIKRLRQNLAHVLDSFPEEARVRLILTEEGQVYTAIESLTAIPAEIYATGVKVITTEVERRNPRLKSTGFISASQSAREEITQTRVFEALLVRNSDILEGMTSNFFYIKDGTLGTARKNILLGVTRRTVLQVARKCNVAILYKPLKLELVPALEESFLTSSSRGIVPVVQIDDVKVGEGIPGPVTQKLIKAYEEYVLRATEQI